MNMVDSSDWPEYFGQDEYSTFFSRAIQNTENLLVPAIVIYDVLKRLLLQLGEGAAFQTAGIISLGRTNHLIKK